MLLLRAVLAAALFVQGWCYLGEPVLTSEALAIGLISGAASVLLLIGLLTPIVGVVVAVSSAGIASSLFPSCGRPVFDSGIPLLFAISILVGIIILGPGAYSVDARLFGRREIIIPRRPDSPGR
ncbi:MAG TPA: hypothetical protein VKB88_35035 [Bryobacteraceae bacterium]|nr:hypothetical protein [Bryobacteraceae bacterium]